MLSSPIYQMEVKMKEMRERPDTPQATPISTYTHTIPFKEQVSQKLHALNMARAAAWEINPLAKVGDH